ncbi:hypothetical protein DPMN_164539 [Dreissena polymorpha]|uniref:Uncharacterized protein n=1 Tax=Dreissena polymorpha TaxID=45954 RepID=A0A9D4EUE6_DREPO|nr:hypothetical protein DPMN_164539 [Dreissena polymorpha]
MPSSFIRSVSEILELNPGATHEVNVISQAEYGSFSDGDSSVVVLKHLLHYLHNEKVKQDGDGADIPDERLLT